MAAITPGPPFSGSHFLESGWRYLRDTKHTNLGRLPASSSIAAGRVSILSVCQHLTVRRRGGQGSISISGYHQMRLEISTCTTRRCTAYSDKDAISVSVLQIFTEDCGRVREVWWWLSGIKKRCVHNTSTRPNKHSRLVFHHHHKPCRYQKR